MGRDATTTATTTTTTTTTPNDQESHRKRVQGRRDKHTYVIVLVCFLTLIDMTVIDCSTPYCPYPSFLPGSCRVHWNENNIGHSDKY